MPVQKNQHYVPQFYQKLFSADGITIGVYLPEKRLKIDSASIKSQASEDYLYTQHTDRTNNTETVLGQVEGKAKLVIELLLQDIPAELTNEQNYALYVFILLQIGRTLAHMEVVQAAADKMLKQLLRTNKQYYDKIGDKSLANVTEETIENLALKFPNLGAFSLLSYSYMIPTCIDLLDSYKILVNRTKVAFTSSDNPVSLYNMFLEKVNHNGAGVGCRGIMFYLPLSPERAVLFYDTKVYKCGRDRHKTVEILDERDVFELNKLTAVNSRELFFYNPNKTKLAELERMAAQKGRFELKDKVVDIAGIEKNSGNVIIGTHQAGNSCKLNLSFMRYMPAYRLKTAKTFNPKTDLYREIAYYKDELEKEFFKNTKKT